MGNGRGLHLSRGAGGEAPREPATADRTLAISGRFPPRNSRRPPRASACITNWRARSLCHVPSSASCRLTLSAGFPARSDQTEALLNLPRTGLAGMRRGDAGSGRQTRSSKACRPDHRCPGTRCPGTRCPGIRCPGIRCERALPGLVVRATACSGPGGGFADRSGTRWVAGEPLSQRGQRSGLKGVDQRTAPLSRGDEARGAEDGEVLGNGRGAELESLCKVRHAARPFAQQVQHASPHGMGNRPKRIVADDRSGHRSYFCKNTN